MGGVTGYGAGPGVYFLANKYDDPISFQEIMIRAPIFNILILYPRTTEYLKITLRDVRSVDLVQLNLKVSTLVCSISYS